MSTSRQKLRILLQARSLRRYYVFIVFVIATLAVSSEIHLQHLSQLAYQLGHSIFSLISTPTPTCIVSEEVRYRAGELFSFTNAPGYNDSFLAIPPSTFQHLSGGDLDGPEVPLACLDRHIAQGAPCGNVKPEKLDLIWAYVNGSDIVNVAAWYANRADAWTSKLPPPKEKLGTFREFGELRYSLRSALKSFRPNLRKIFILGTDFPLPGCEGWRGGQMPQWLSSSRRDRDVPLELIHHSNIFPALHNKTILNSYAIETRIHHTPGLSKYHVHMNDDIFVNQNMTNFDFYSSAFGPVFRVDLHQLVQWKPFAVNAEWPALVASNKLLDARFGERPRPHTEHISKTLGVHFMREIESIWSEEFTLTASHSFRNNLNQKPPTPDIYPGFMMVHYAVERWREALLWSFIVASLGGDDDEWDGDSAWSALGSHGIEHMVVQRGPRNTLDQLDVTLARQEFNPKTQYVYSSFDGYPYSGLGNGDFRAFPVFNATKTGPGKVCLISRALCFPRIDGEKASYVFKRVAFEVPSCGDCVVDALMDKSGALGLNAFLPAPDRRYGQRRWFKPAIPTPRLPLARNWNTTDFSLIGVLGNNTGVMVREWVEQALIRYRFVVGETPFSFMMLRTHKDVKNVTAIDDKPALACLNDDAIRDVDAIRMDLTAWFEKKWPEPAEWEGVVGTEKGIWRRD